MKTTLRHLVVLIALSLFLVGCATVTRENYAQIQTGMTLDEVVKILGEPDELDSVGIGPLEASTATWRGKQGTISIQFAADKVLIKRFLNEGEGDPDKGKN